METKTFNYESTRIGYVITKQVKGIDGEMVTLAQDNMGAWVHPMYPGVKVYSCTQAQYEMVTGWQLQEGESWTPFKCVTTHAITLG